MIDGVVVTTLEFKHDDRGRLAELFRADDRSLSSFGQVHLTTIDPGVIKAWHRHKDRTDTLVCISGRVRLGLFDGRPDSRTTEQLNQFFLGDQAPLRVTIPPGVWFGLRGLGDRESLVVVYTDKPHDPKWPDEERQDPLINDIPFDWERRDR